MPIRQFVAAALATVVLAGCATPAQPAGTASVTTTTPTQSKKLTVITHDSFALADETVASVQGRHRLRRHVRRPRRRRHGGQPARPDQGRAAGRRGVRHRQHVRRSADRRRRADPLLLARTARRRRGAGRRRPELADPRRLRRRLPERRHGLVQGTQDSPCPRPSTTCSSPSTRTCSWSPTRLVLAGAGLPDRHRRREGRSRLPRLLDGAEGQRRQGGQGLDGGLHRRVLRLLRQGRPAPGALLRLLARLRTGDRSAGPHLLPAGRVRGGDRRRAERGRRPRSSSTSCCRTRCRRRSRRRCT